MAGAPRVEPDDAAQTARLVKSTMEAGGVSLTATARELGVSPAALSRWLRGKYAGDVGALDERARRWMASRAVKAERAAVMVQAPEWVDTPTALSVMSSLMLAHYTPTMAVVYGGAGMGKTAACRRYRDTNNNVFLVTMNPAVANSLTGALEMILGELRARPAVSRPNRLFAQVTERLAGTSGLLIIDEAQALSPRALETVRAIYDETNVGLALVGGELVYSRMTGGVRAAHFAQLFSRVGVQKHLLRPTSRDVEALAAAMGVKGGKEREFLRQVSARPGALREVALTCQLAAQIAVGEEKGVAVTVDHLRAAYRRRAGE